jgi:hypothetical protein
MLLFHLSAPLALTPQQWQTWQRRFDESVAFEELPGTLHGPLQGVLALHGAYEPDDIITAVIAAFASIGLTQGTIEIALSDHARHDEELETPPFYEREIDLARGPEPELARVQIEIMHGEPYTTTELEALERALRAHLTWPVQSFVAVSPSIKGRHLARLELVPLPQERLPPRAELKARTSEALAAAQFRPRRVKVGAYLGTWDNTLFDEIL